MAVPMNFCCLAILSAYLALTAQADCGTDCAYCAVQESFRKSDINPTMCMWQCAADFSGGSSWGPCRDLLQSSNTAATAAAAATAESEDLPTEPEQQQDAQLHQLAKKYGGFMKRYGGFMKRYGGFMKRYGGFMKKSDETYGLEPDDIDHGREILTFRTERGDGEKGVDSLSVLRELLSAKGGEEAAEGIAKRYGGFMRRAGLYDSLSGGARPLQKRYGGFMRRVGWPEWLEESKRYGGFMRRSPGEDEEGVEEEEGEEEQEPQMEKRYGGFMGY
ncbi:proenkephalin-A-B-like [Clupea harengus]|uniref:Proenkephalin-A-B n=1 Tax=Clupea harengus TaxID=7950 RepID=A0A6P3VNF3_CLUHA|nr:proenkephalin-A-B [Clupea harengus]XP_031439887.1 proenkephalin-A-B-like [Clupea harengus]